MATIEQILEEARRKDTQLNTAKSQLLAKTNPTNKPLPKVEPKKEPFTPYTNEEIGRLQHATRIPIRGSLTGMEDKVRQNTEYALNKNAGTYGFMEGFNPLSAKRQLERNIGQPIDTSEAEGSGAYKVGYGAGLMGQYLTTGGVAHGAVRGGITKAIPKLVQNATRTQKVLGTMGASALTDVLTGVPINTVQAIKESSTDDKVDWGKFAKSFAVNTAIDVLFGGLIEGGIALKSGKKVKTVGDLANLTKAEADEVTEVITKRFPKRKQLHSKDVNYRGLHTAPINDGFNAPLHDLTKIYPEDVYSSKAANLYGHRIPEDKKAAEIVQKFRNNPEAEVTVYRAVPEGASHKVNRGDWVTLTEAYAKIHGDSNLDENYKIIKNKVKAKDIYTNGDSIHEFGYDGGVAFSGTPKKLKIESTLNTSLTKAEADEFTEVVSKMAPQKELKATRPSGGRVGRGLEKFYTQAVDSQRSLAKATKNLPMAADKDIKIVGSNARNVRGTSEYVFRNNLVDMEGKALNNKSLENILTVKGSEKTDFNEYLLHRHNIARFQKDKPIWMGDGFRPTVTDKQSVEMVKQYEAKYPHFKEHAKELDDFNPRLIDEWAVRSGLISDEFADYLKTTYPNYVPTIREGSVPGEKFTPKGVKANPGIKKAEGGNKPIMAITKSYPLMVQNIMKAARQNEVYNALLETVEQYPKEMSQWAKVVDAPNEKVAREYLTEVMSKEALEENGIEALGEIAEKMLEIDTRNGKYYVTAMRKGKPVRMEVHKDLFDGFKSLAQNYAEGTLDAAAQLVRQKATNPFKALITGYNPFFALRNIARDVPTSYIQGTEHNPLKWGANLARATKSIAKKDEAYKEYLAMGGKKTGFFNAEKGIDAANLPTRIGRMAGEKIQAFNELTETIPRYGEYIGTVRREGGDYAAKQKGIYNAGEVTVNFGRSGPTGKSVDAFVPYLNPAIQGIDKSIRALQHGSTWAKGLGAITIPTSILYAVNHRTPEDANAYDQLDTRTKDNNYVIPIGDGKFIKIPKSRESGLVFGSLFERLTNLVLGKDEPFKGFDQALKLNFAPANPFTDNIVAPLTYNIPTNKDFAGRAIVPMNMGKDGYGDARSKYLQYDESTSEIGKWFGQVAKDAGINNGEGFSPKVIDYLIDSYLGIIGDVMLPATTKGDKGVSPTLPNYVKGALDKTLVRPFTADNIYNNNIQNDFYEKFNEAKKARTDLNITQDIPSEWVTPEDKRVSVYTQASIEMSQLRKREKEIMSTVKDGKSKDEMLRKVRQQIIDIAAQTPQKAEFVYQKYKSTYIPELSMLSENQINDYRTIAQPRGVTPQQYYESYKAQKGYSTNIGKSLALINTKSNTPIEAFGISEKSYALANALATSNLGKNYNSTYENLKGITGSEDKKAIIDALNPGLPYEKITLLYEAFDVSQGVGRYQRQFN
jgi:hypothetical protein